MKTRLYIFALLAITSLSLIFAGAMSAQMKSAAAPKVRSEMLVSTEWLARHLKDKNLFVLHVSRESKAYEEGHVPGARHVAFAELLTTHDGVANELPSVEKLQKLFEGLGIGDQGKIVIYGDINGLAAARTFFTLDYLGQGDRVALLDGGLEKWKAENRQIETHSVAPVAAKFTPHLRPNVVSKLDAMRDLSWVAANIQAPDVAIIDARPETQYAGSPNQRNGHIPGAANIFWMNHLKSSTDPTLKSASELQKLYEAAGLKPGQKVITYCNTGMQASHTYFTLKYLGYDVSMYDGSFSEWSKAEGAPIVVGKERK